MLGAIEQIRWVYLKKNGFEFWQQQALTPDNRYEFHRMVKSFQRSPDFQSYKRRFEDAKLKTFFLGNTPPLSAANDQFRGILSARQSNRDFEESPLSQSQLGHILKTAIVSENHQAAYPSAGGLHSVQTYCIVNSVQGLQSGIYFYSSKDHTLRQIIAFQDPDQQYALVLNQGSGDVGVIRIASIRQGGQRKAPLFTMIPVGGTPVAALVRSVA